MPNYALQCGCGHRWETFARMAERSKLRCPECGGRAETDFSAGCATVERTWHGAETRSMSLGVDPSQVDQAMRANPGWEFDRKTGDAIFNSDRDMRKKLKALNEQSKRESERPGARADLARSGRAK